MSDGRIAVVGMGLRLPGADTPEGYWHTVRHGHRHIRRFTPEELAAAGVSPELYQRPDFVGASAPLPDIDRFDADFFSMSTRESVITDPQHRLFLEVCHHALEDAGYAAPDPSLRVGVYAAAGYQMLPLRTYLLENVLAEDPGPEWIPRLQRTVGNSSDFMATRAAFRLGLTGPALGVQSACSSSLVAVHLARQTLLAGDADLMVAGASAIHLPRVLGYRHATGSILSPTGDCRAFDAASDGTVPGSGVAAVVLKRLDRALADRDTVYGVILGSGVTNDGSRKRHFTEPSAQGQRDALRAALHSAGVGADTLGYLEAHGTGTYKGDPIELAAATEVFRAHTDRRRFCAVGSVKANVGHLDVTAGLAGLIKALLVLREGVVPPLAGHTAPNPALSLDDSPFWLPTEELPWPGGRGPRRAGVTALGVGGTNAHVVVEQPPDPRPRQVHGPAPAMLPLYGRQPAALVEGALALRDRLVEDPAPDLADLTTTLALGRRPLRHRLVVLGEDVEALRRGLEDFLGGRTSSRFRTEVVPRTRLAPVTWAFSGHGGIRPGMGSALYQRFAVVREVLDDCEERYRDECGGSLLDGLLDRRPVHRPGEDPEVWPTDTAQPALFALQSAQARLWAELTGEPAEVLGHSVGELAALHVAGALSREDGLRLTALRGRLMRRGAGPGGMVAVLGPERLAHEALERFAGLELAVVNGEENRVLSGPAPLVDQVCAHLEAVGAHWRRLPVDRAFHSAALDPVLPELARAVAGVTLRPLTVPLVSGLDGRVRPEGWLPTGEYLTAQARQPVRFDLVLRELADRPGGTLLELGPDRTLCGLASRAAPALTALPTQRPGEGPEGPATCWSSLAALHCAGHRLDWERLVAGSGGGRVRLPGYRFQRRAHWVGPPPARLEPGPAPRRPQPPVDTKGSAMETLVRVRELTASQLGFDLDEVEPDKPFFDLGADSLQMINVLRELEAEFGVRVRMRELFEEAETPRLLATLVADRAGAAAPVTEPSDRATPAPAPVTEPASPAERPAPDPVAAVSFTHTPAVHHPPVAVDRPASAPEGHVTQEQFAELTEQVRQLTRNQLRLTEQLSLLLDRRLASREDVA
ncbi:beta-ketoacyl synthase N-terminal-like domain-containing protein [Streptomyces sp. NPDC005438]|uniref:type I polyketide synthase n=1 Tax=Streptomyces sp. NPDC005438 TaxID=3156880 RepID=UPI00339DE3D9